MKSKHHIRLLARLDIKGDRLVKGINLEGLRPLGSAEVYSKYYTDAGIDELLIMDTVASLYGRENLFNFVKKIAKDIFIPKAVGGGLRTTDDIQQAFLSGADKVVLNTAALLNPTILNEAVNMFGSSSIVASVEAKKSDNGTWFAFYNSGRTNSHRNIIDWIKEVQDRGVGEILITDIDSEGTGKGFSYTLFEKVSSVCFVPLAVSGGAGKKNDCLTVVPFVNSIALASILHYGVPDEIRDKALSSQVSSGFAPVQYSYKNKNFEFAEISEIKKFLSVNGYDMRLSA